MESFIFFMNIEQTYLNVMKNMSYGNEFNWKCSCEHKNSIHYIKHHIE